MITERQLQLEQALVFYAKHENWDKPVLEKGGTLLAPAVRDRGQVARKALSE